MLSGRLKDKHNKKRNNPITPRLFAIIQSKVAFQFLEALVMQKAILDVRLKFVIGAEVCELNRWAISCDEGIQLGAPKLGQFYDEGTAEPMVNVTIFLFTEQAVLKGKHPAISAELKHVYKFIDIQANTAVR